MVFETPSLSPRLRLEHIRNTIGSQSWAVKPHNRSERDFCAERTPCLPCAQRAALCSEDDLENRKFTRREDRVEAVAKLLEGFFSTAPEGIGNSQRLALLWPRRAHVLRDGLTEVLVRQQRDNNGERLVGLYNIFKTQVFHALTTKEFADAFAQTLVYGLFLARLNAKPNEKITLENARANVPGSFRLIRELVSFLDELEKDEYVEIR